MNNLSPAYEQRRDEQKPAARGKQSSVLGRLAAALAATFSLPEPETLADLLEVPAEEDISSLLEAWIAKCLLDLDEAQATQFLPMLVARLDRLLTNGRAHEE
ncbi:MAG: hypothetical protein PHO57_06365 [Acidithiobacillus sp.]|nr:hypothetical protein [Acidithiobacillus sp.]